MNIEHSSSGSSPLSVGTTKPDVQWCPEDNVVQIPDIKTTIPPSCIFVCGYKRTGKDTFCSDLISGNFRYGWRVYTSPSEMSTDKGSMFYMLLNEYISANRVAFADKIRTNLVTLLGLGEGFDFEGNKDTIVINGKLVRQHMIDMGSDGRRYDKGFWIKHALAKYFVPRNTDSSTGYDKTLENNNRVVVSDLRFMDEYRLSLNYGINITTVRLFRKSVPIPDIKIESEHNLDNLATDYLLVPTSADFDAAKTAMPVYRGYVLVYEIAV